MTDPKDQIAALVQAAEEAAYKRGWDDAAAAILEAATEARAQRANGSEADAIPFPADEPRRTGRPPSVTIQVVEDCINAAPGKKGVEVVKAAQMVDPMIPERTVRTALRRLKMSKKIWQRNGLWYPKPTRLRDLVENDDGEANSSPPHH
jgi:hypothetical protein